MGWEYYPGDAGDHQGGGWHEGFLVAEFDDGKRALGISGTSIPVGHLAVDQYGDGSFGQEAASRHGGDGAFHTRPAGEVIGWRIACNCYSAGDTMPSKRWFSQQLWVRVPSPVQHNPAAFRIYAADDDIYDVDTTDPAAHDVWWNEHINAIDAAAGIEAALATIRAGEAQLDEAVIRAREKRLSWAKIGAAAGISPQAAHERWSKRCIPTTSIQS
ncbi:AsnC family protein [Mycolicibacterium houstonense]|uniref:AsnC family protein n=1 Tax=Mycolicibacterium houstonense TaxID=146021 RepID=UPI000831799A|nr:AsnC family protein [Mycolicibacterium houstonense]